MNFEVVAEETPNAREQNKPCEPRTLTLSESRVAWPLVGPFHEKLQEAPPTRPYLVV